MGKLITKLMLVLLTGCGDLSTTQTEEPFSAPRTVDPGLTQNPIIKCTPGSDETRCRRAQCLRFGMEREKGWLLLRNDCPQTIFFDRHETATDLTRWWSVKNADGVPVAWFQEESGFGCVSYEKCERFVPMDPGRVWAIPLPVDSRSPGYVCTSPTTSLERDHELVASFTFPLPVASPDPDLTFETGSCHSSKCERQIAISETTSPSCFSTPNQLIVEDLIKFRLEEFDHLLPKF